MARKVTYNSAPKAPRIDGKIALKIELSIAMGMIGRLGCSAWFFLGSHAESKMLTSTTKIMLEI